jgi:hypothetical protein
MISRKSIIASVVVVIILVLLYMISSTASSVSNITTTTMIPNNTTTTISNEFGITTTATPALWLQTFYGYDCTGNDISQENNQQSAQDVPGARGIVLNQYGGWYVKSSSSNGFYSDGVKQSTWYYYSSYAIPAASNLQVGWVNADFCITSPFGLSLNSTPGKIYTLNLTNSSLAAQVRATGQTGPFVYNSSTSRVCFFSNI